MGLTETMPQLHSLPDGQAARFAAALAREVEPLAAALRMSVVWRQPEAAEWLVTSFSCACREEQRLGAEACCADRQVELLPVRLEERLLGELRLCLDESCARGKDAIERLAQLLIKQLRQEDEEEALLEELSLSWESLEAIYEISADLKMLENPRLLLNRIMDRAVAIQESLKAIFWLRVGEALEPLAKRHVGKVPPKSERDSLVWKAVISGRALVINGHERLRAEAFPDGELERATSVLVIPVATKHSVLGAIEIWREQANKEFDSRTLRLVEALAHQGAIVIENDRLHRESIESARLRQEVEIGSKIQQTLLFEQVPQDLRGLKVAALSIPSASIDGDFYDFIRHNDECLDIIVGDVMGKGVPAALLGAATKSQFLRASGRLVNHLANEASTEPFTRAGGLRLPAPQDILQAVHAEVTRQFMAFDRFVTVCYARFDGGSRKLSFVDGGHTKTVHYQHASRACRFLEGDNLPLGVLLEERYGETSIAFQAGDVFLFYSDGVTEAKSRQGELFGETRLAACVAANCHLSAKALLEAIRDAVVVFSETTEFADDFTCVAVMIVGEEAPDGKEVDKKAGAIERRTADTAERRELWLAAEVGELARLREFVGASCHQLFGECGNDDLLRALQLGVNEAATNIIQHACPPACDDHPQQGIHILIERLASAALAADARKEADEVEADDPANAERIRITLSHRGAAFQPESVPPPSFDGSRDGGFGVFIMRSLMDEVEYRSAPDGRQLTILSKKIDRGD